MTYLRRVSHAVCASVVALSLVANAFDLCLIDFGSYAAAMACCAQHKDDCSSAVAAAACCKTRSAGTRLADAPATFDLSQADAALTSTVWLPPALASNVAGRCLVCLPQTADESPPPSPFVSPLRI